MADRAVGQLLGLDVDDAVVAISFRRVDRAAVGVLKHARACSATTEWLDNLMMLRYDAALFMPAPPES